MSDLIDLLGEADYFVYLELFVIECVASSVDGAATCASRLVISPHSLSISISKDEVLWWMYVASCLTNGGIDSLSIVFAARGISRSQHSQSALRSHHFRPKSSMLVVELTLLLNVLLLSRYRISLSP